MVRKFLDFASCLEQWQDNDNDDDGDANDDDNCDDYDDGDDGDDDDLPSIAQKNCLHFSICACHPCAGAVLTFSASFQLKWMLGNARFTRE